MKVEQLEQSLLTTEQYKKFSRKRTYNITGRIAQHHGNPPPNWKMGDSLTKEEVEIFNYIVQDALNTAGLLHKQKTHE